MAEGPDSDAESPPTRRGAALADDAAVAALPLLEIEDRLEEMALAEVGPERGRDPDLAVGDLPEEEVRDAHFAARADEKIRVGQPGRAEARSESLLVDLLGGEPSRAHVMGEGAAGVHDLRAAAVVQSDVERHAAAGRGSGKPLGELLLDGGIELVHPADHAEPDVVLEQVRELAVQVLLE